MILEKRGHKQGKFSFNGPSEDKKPQSREYKIDEPYLHKLETLIRYN